MSVFLILAISECACLCLTHTDMLILVVCECSVVKRAGLVVVESTVRGGGGGRHGEVCSCGLGLMALL